MTSQQPALYYPYIHIRNEHWLKATLLYTPSVKRIVPKNYKPEDQSNIKPYTTIKGLNGPLLQTVPAYSHAAAIAQQTLLQKLQANEKAIIKQYSKPHAPSTDEYWIHDAKFHEELLEYLKNPRQETFPITTPLAWPSHDHHAYGNRTWYALHPTLGSAIMTTIGLSIAREQDYDIVTPSTHAHETLLTTQEEQIFEALLYGKKATTKPGTQVEHDLGQLIITTACNLQALPPKKIPKLQQSKHFQAFQRQLQKTAHTIPAGAAPRDYTKALKIEAEDLITAWKESKQGLSKDITDALYEVGAAISTDAAAQAATGTIKYEQLAAVAGITILLQIRRIPKRYKEATTPSPYQFLTKIRGAEERALQATFPLGI